MAMITIGETAAGHLALDLEVMLRTRMLVQANSGGGKSWLLRRLAEQLHGRVQVVIVDPEGEFATLRERFGYVLAGPGGETPADPRSAELLAHRLLELQASAICDLYELRPHERHRWVKVFLEALIDAPKSLWRPLVVIVDEAHVFCPEKGAGESEAAAAMIDLATRGRKRGFCPIFATQRLGKLRKDAAAELTNVVVGRTWMDVDRDRAAEMLGVSRADREAFMGEIRTLRPGRFYAMGPALSTARVLVTVGAVETTHAEAGAGKHAAVPAPTPESVRALLPKLSDLPKEAEAKQQTEAELRAEIRELKAQLARAEGATGREEAERTEALRRQALAHAQELREGLIRETEAVRDLAERLDALSAMDMPDIELPPAPAIARSQPAPTAAPPPRAAVMAAAVDGITRPQAAIMTALARMQSVGRKEPTRSWVALLAGASPKSSAYANNLSALRTAGLIEYGGNGTVMLTSAGAKVVPAQRQPLTTSEQLSAVMDMLPRPQQAIVAALHRLSGRPLAREAVAAAAGASPTSSAFANNLSALRTLGVIEYAPDRTVRCADWMYL